MLSLQTWHFVLHPSPSFFGIVFVAGPSLFSNHIHAERGPKRDCGNYNSAPNYAPMQSLCSSGGEGSVQAVEN